MKDYFSPKNKDMDAWERHADNGHKKSPHDKALKKAKSDSGEGIDSMHPMGRKYLKMLHKQHPEMKRTGVAKSK